MTTGCPTGAWTRPRDVRSVYPLFAQEIRKVFARSPAVRLFSTLLRAVRSSIRFRHGCETIGRFNRCLCRIFDRTLRDCRSSDWLWFNHGMLGRFKRCHGTFYRFKFGRTGSARHFTVDFTGAGRSPKHARHSFGRAEYGELNICSNNKILFIVWFE